MKKSMILLGMLSIGYANAQTGRVGINTSTPDATLDVKAKTNNGSKVLELQNSAGTKLVTALDNGNTGINTTTPTQKLDINGNARVRQMPSGLEESVYTKAVVADANGNLAVVSRTNPSIPNSTQVIFGKKTPTTIVEPNETFWTMQTDGRGAYHRYTGTSITLPPGKWIIYCGYLIAPTKRITFNIPSANMNNIVVPNVWFRGIIDDNPTTKTYTQSELINLPVISGSPQYISTNLAAGQNYSMANGVWFVDNNTNADKTYYVKISISPSEFTASATESIQPVSKWMEDYIIAIKRE